MTIILDDNVQRKALMCASCADTTLNEMKRTGGGGILLHGGGTPSSTGARQVIEKSPKRWWKFW